MLGGKELGLDLPQVDVELSSPTSSRMKDSFLIKNGT